MFKVIIKSFENIFINLKINILLESSIINFEENLINNAITIFDNIFKNQDQIYFSDLLNEMQSKFNNSKEYSLFIIKSLLYYFIYNQVLWID